MYNENVKRICNYLPFDLWHRLGQVLSLWQTPMLTSSHSRPVRDELLACLSLNPP